MQVCERVAVVTEVPPYLGGGEVAGVDVGLGRPNCLVDLARRSRHALVSPTPLTAPRSSTEESRSAEIVGVKSRKIWHDTLSAGSCQTGPSPRASKTALSPLASSRSRNLLSDRPTNISRAHASLLGPAAIGLADDAQLYPISVTGEMAAATCRANSASTSKPTFHGSRAVPEGAMNRSGWRAPEWEPSSHCKTIISSSRPTARSGSSEPSAPALRKCACHQASRSSSLRPRTARAEARCPPSAPCRGATGQTRERDRYVPRTRSGSHN